VLLFAVLLIFVSAGLFLAGVKSFWNNPKRGLTCVICGVVTIGAALSILHAIGQEGF
jgi:hypothetical protein